MGSVKEAGVNDYKDFTKPIGAWGSLSTSSHTLGQEMAEPVGAQARRRT